MQYAAAAVMDHCIPQKFLAKYKKVQIILYAIKD
jgi:hypothetical protein